MLSQKPCWLIKGKFVILCVPEQEKHEFNYTCDCHCFFYVYHDLSLPVKSETQYTLSFLLVLCVYQVWNNKCL